MGRKLLILGALAMGLFMLGRLVEHPGKTQAAGGAPGAAAPQECDRTCLSEFADRYVAALLTHDPSGLPMAGTAKLTENTKQVALGDGLWKTIKFVKFQGETIADPSTGQVTIWDGVQEDHVSLAMIRLKVWGGKITEVETIVAHGSDPQTTTRNGFEVLPDLQLLAVIKPFLENEVPVTLRASRKELIAAANSYFDGIEHQPGHVPFAPGCNRIENGQLTTNNPTNSEGLPPQGCQQQFQSKIFSYIPHVRDRRFPVVDEARGLVVAQVVFDIPGSKTWVRDGKEIPAPPAVSNPRNNILNELFKVEHGQIQLIQAFMLSNEHYGTPTGWN
jgi:hypothetical protein